MEKTEYIAMYSEFLREEGFSPTVDEGGYIVFMFEGSRFCLFIDAEINYFCLIYPDFWSIDSEKEREAAMRSAMEVTLMVNVAKVIVSGESVGACFQMLCANPEDFKSVIRNAMLLLMTAEHEFRKKMLEFFREIMDKRLQALEEEEDEEEVKVSE